jgi:drug/metabolite transporter (DMT)-like permease
VLSLIWGSSFILIKKALIAIKPVELACLRISISAIAFIPVLYFNWHKVDWRKWKAFLIVGALGSGIPAFLFAFAQTGISSSLAGLLNSLTPVFTLIIGILVFRQKFKILQFTGVILGLIGAVSLVLMDSAAGISEAWYYAMLVIIGTVCYATSVNTVQFRFQKVTPVIVSSVSFALIGPPAIIYLAGTGFFTEVLSRDYAAYSVAATFILSIFSTVLASILFFGLVQKTSAVFGSSVTYIMPIIAISWGLADGEVLLWFHLIGMAMILTGIYLIKS